MAVAPHRARCPLPAHEAATRIRPRVLLLLPSSLLSPASPLPLGLPLIFLFSHARHLTLARRPSSIPVESARRGRIAATKRCASMSSASAPSHASRDATVRRQSKFPSTTPRRPRRRFCRRRSPSDLAEHSSVFRVSTRIRSTSSLSSPCSVATPRSTSSVRCRRVAITVVSTTV